MSWLSKSDGRRIETGVIASLKRRHGDKSLDHLILVISIRRSVCGCEIQRGINRQNERETPESVYTFSPAVALGHVHSRKSRPRSIVHGLNSNHFLTEMEQLRVCMCVPGGIEEKGLGGCTAYGRQYIPMGAERRKNRMLNCDNDTLRCYTSTRSHTNKHKHTLQPPLEAV